MPTLHLSPEAALDYLEGRLDFGQETVWKQHLDRCSSCRDELRRWREVWTAVKRSHLKSAPEYDLERAFRVFPHRPDESSAKRRCVLAAIIFDSFLDPSLVGARGVTADARQIVLRADELDIHVQIWGERDHRQMLGQMLPRSGRTFAETVQSHLLRDGKKLETRAVDDLGEFLFTDVPEDDLTLQVDLPNLTVICALNFKEIQ